MLVTFFGMGSFHLPLAIPFWLASFLCGILCGYCYFKFPTLYSVSLLPIYILVFLIMALFFSLPWWITILMLGISQWRFKERFGEEKNELEWNLGLLVLFVLLTFCLFNIHHFFSDPLGKYSIFFVDSTWTFSGLVLYLFIYLSIPLTDMITHFSSEKNQKKKLLLILLTIITPFVSFTLIFEISKGIHLLFTFLVTGIVYLFSWFVNPIYHFLQSVLAHVFNQDSGTEKLKNENNISLDPSKGVRKAHLIDFNLSVIIYVLIFICLIITLYILFRKKPIVITKQQKGNIHTTREKINIHEPDTTNRILYSAAENRVRLAVQSIENDFGSTPYARRTSETFSEWMTRLSFQNKIDVKLYEQIRYGKVEPVESLVIKFEKDCIELMTVLKNDEKRA